MEGTQAFAGRATHGNTLVMRRSPDDDEYQDDEDPKPYAGLGHNARGVPDRPVNGGNLRSLADSPRHRLTSGQAG